MADFDFYQKHSTLKLVGYKNHSCHLFCINGLRLNGGPLKPILKKLNVRVPKIFETESLELEKKKAVIKLTQLSKERAWYIVEAEELHNDIMFWGVIKENRQVVLDFFSLNELASVAIDEKDSIIEDKSFIPIELMNIM